MRSMSGTAFPSAFQQVKMVKRSKGFTFWLLSGGAIAVVLIALAMGIFELPNLTRVIWLFSGGVGLVAIVYFKQGMRLDWLSTPIVYAAVFWVFHFGLVFPGAIYPTLLDSFAWWDRDWLDTPETQKAVLLSLLFLLCFLFGSFSHQRKQRLSPGRADKFGKTSGQELIIGGWICMAIGALIAVIGLNLFGFKSFLQTYEEFFSISTLFSFSIIIISFGLMLQVAGGRSVRKVLLTSVLVYLPVALPTLLAGSRMAPLFSLSVLGIVLAKRGVRLSRLGLVLGALFLLGLVAMVSETRQAGLSQSSSARYLTAGKPLSGLTEIGGSLRPVYALINDLENFRQDYFYGYTYIYPVFRQVGHMMGLESDDDYTNSAFIARYISLRYGAIGFSTVAEAFFNGGVLGVILFALLWGNIIAYLDRRAGSPYGLALLSAVLIPMMFNIRNSFIHVPAWIFMGLVVIGFCRFFLATRKRSH